MCPSFGRIACSGHKVTNEERHEFRLFAPVEKLCVGCHHVPKRNFAHEPVADGACLECHDAHGSEHQALLISDPRGDLCMPCHEYGDCPDPRYPHDPVVAGDCDVCHEAHTSWEPFLLTRREAPLCLDCHGGVDTDMRVEPCVHAPLLDGMCTQCHVAHGSDHRAQLRIGVPGLCFSCHEHEDIQALVEAQPEGHGDMGGRAACNACHAGHACAKDALVVEPTLEICLKCHDNKILTEDGRVLQNFATLLAENGVHHGPIADGSCSPCHNPHRAPYANLLTGDFPQRFYVPYERERYELCFDCHLERLATEPQGVGITGFADGTTNLHHVHVTADKRGRTCKACHKMHASDLPFLMRRSIPFGSGGWSIEINFRQTDTGGTCMSACHEERPYVRPTGEGAAFPRGNLRPHEP